MLLRSVHCKNKQKRILHACHVDVTAGHMGKTRTLFKIKDETFYIQHKFRDHLTSCLEKKSISLFTKRERKKNNANPATRIEFGVYCLCRRQAVEE